MNEVMPDWRTFGASGPPGDGRDPDEAGERAAPSRRRAVGLALSIVGACGLGAGLVLIVLLLWPGGSPGQAGVAMDVGSELGVATQDGGGPALDAADDSVTAIVVDVAGAVIRPGLVRLRRGDRVGDAISAAGGFSPRVDLAEAGRSLNLAATLDDGAKVIVAELGSEPAPVAAAPGDGRVDLNTADQAELEALPGIGPVTATRIIEAREAQPFGSVDDLRTRDVVGEAVFEDIQDLVRVSG